MNAPQSFPTSGKVLHAMRDYLFYLAALTLEPSRFSDWIKPPCTALLLWISGVFPLHTRLSSLQQASYENRRTPLVLFPMRAAFDA